MAGPEELLETGRRRLPHAGWLAVLVIAAAATVAALLVHPSTSTHPHSARSTKPSAPPAPSRRPAVAVRNWPTAAGACGADPELAIVHSTPPRERTGISLLVGSSAIRRVDFDAATVTTVPHSGLVPGEYVWALVSARDTYALTATCRPGRQRAVRIGAGGAATPVPLFGQILSDGAHGWIATSPDSAQARGTLTPLGSGRRVRLPAGFAPFAVMRGVAVGQIGSRIVTVDVATGRVRTTLGSGTLLATGHGAVLWTQRCDVSIDAPCVLLRRSIGGASTTRFRLPRPPGFSAATLSADGARVAFTMERATPDERFTGHPLPPTDVAVLDLHTGAVQRIPGIEAPPKSALGLAFSADGTWLVVALDAGARTRLLAWRPGLTTPYETTPVPGQVYAAPAIALAP